MYQQNEKIILSSQESEIIRNALNEIEYDAKGGMNYLNKLKQTAYNIFPERVIVGIEKMKLLTEEAYGCISIENLPIDNEVTGSPLFKETGSSFKGGTISENVLIALSLIAGEPYSISHEGLELVNNLTPHPDATKEYTGLGSEVELDFHIENAAQAHMPEGDTSPLFLMLLGIRTDIDNGPFTRIADMRNALKLMSKEDIKELYQSNYIIKVPYRWRDATITPRSNTGLVPVLSGPITCPQITAAFYPDMMVTANIAAKQALDNLYEALKKVSFGVQITPGRLIILNNHFVLHSRDQFEAKYDKNGRAYRWVQRVFVAPTLWNYRNYQRLHERVFNAKNLINNDSAA
ncbi:TauD/TfdA family dioxygenase [Providencia sp. PROV196]|uniref:TauD/TfdA family dioxygenase n=1 Tax=Providencia sp. PROV196 TaxID=2949897 RepID=UPI00234AEEF8|nr:TauD/TfdA family dioxygenase [Providencia sp. PROV196]